MSARTGWNGMTDGNYKDKVFQRSTTLQLTKLTVFLRVLWVHTLSCYPLSMNFWWRCCGCVKQTLRVRCPPLNWGGGQGDWAQGLRRPLRAAEFIFFEFLVAISFPIEVDVWGRLCTHFEAAKVMTFAPVTQNILHTCWTWKTTVSPRNGWLWQRFQRR
jgi:hypothetical protein